MSTSWISVKVLKKIDWLLVAISLLLTIFGLIVIYSLDANTGQGFPFFYKQLIFLIIGLVIWAVSFSFNYQHFKSYSLLFYILGLLILASLFIFGQEIRGVKGWFIIGPVSIQPVEFVKLFVIIFFAKLFTEKGHLLYQTRHLVNSVLLIIPYLGLLALQPDLGSAFIVGVIWFVMLLFTKVKGRQVLILVAVALLLSVAGWNLLAGYQKDRLTTFLHPGADPQGSGYNIQQALTAIGSGQLLGQGLGQGSQTQLHFLPENRTDFIFAVIAEELGFVGAMILLVLFFILLLRLLKIARGASNAFGIYLVLGITVFIGAQTYMNIAMNLSLFPVTGIPLPLVSQGGSSLWSVLLALGIAQSVWVYD